MSGLEHIAEVFMQTKADGRAALMPYFTLGFPTRAISLDAIETIARSGADLIELGVPFSDPLADGPTIQHSTHVALENGASTRECLEMVGRLRQRGVSQPLMLMGYYNPILAYGPEHFVEDACQAGADGLIVPDLPIEEGATLQGACSRRGLSLTYLVAPTTPDERLARVTTQSTGFVYCVSLTGVTGARSRIADSLLPFLRRVRQATNKPRAVGFGISTPGQAKQVGRNAEGVIVGSALINVVAAAVDPVATAGAFIAQLRKALE